MYTAVYELDEVPPDWDPEPGQVIEMRTVMHRIDALARPDRVQGA